MISYFYQNSFKLWCIFLLALIIVSFTPSNLLMSIPFDEIFAYCPPSYYLLGTISVIIFSISIAVHAVVKQLTKYLTTFKNNKSYFTLPIYIAWLLLFAILLFVCKVKFGIEGLIVFTYFMFILLLLRLVVKPGHHTPPARDDLWFSDEPIPDKTRDLLRRDFFVENLYRQVIELPFADSFVFGLDGRLGQGKTSIINLLKEKFKNNQNFILVDYAPWNFSSEEAMLNSFYQELEKCVRRTMVVPGFKRTLSKYQKLLSPEMSGFGLKIGMKVEETLEEIRLRLEEYINVMDKKIFIIVDDIDRLQPSEILSIFKLIRLNAKFKHTYFLLSFDGVRVKNKVETIAGVDYEYLEKFIQKKIPLPRINREKIDEFLNVHLTKLFEEIGYSDNQKVLFEENFSVLYKNYIWRIFRDLRKVKIYLNGLRFTLPIIHTEIDYSDFCVLELLQTFYPNVYRDIWDNYGFYLPGLSDGRNFFKITALLTNHENEKFEKIKNHIEQLLVQETDKELILELLKNLFPLYIKRAYNRNYEETGIYPYNVYSRQKRITDAESFGNYFMLTHSENGVSYLEVSEKMQEWAVAEDSKREELILTDIMDLQNQNRLDQFLRKAERNVHEIPFILVQSIINVLCQNNNKFYYTGGEEIYSRPEWYIVCDLTLKLIERVSEDANISSMIEQGILAAPNIMLPIFALNRIEDLAHRPYPRLISLVNTTNLRNKTVKKLRKRFTEEGNDVFKDYKNNQDWQLVISTWVKNSDTANADNFREANDYLLDLFARNQSALMTAIRYITYWKTESKGIYDIEAITAIAKGYVAKGNLTAEEKQWTQEFLAAFEMSNAVNA